MTFLVQHGYGKSDKIERALDECGASGVIYAPRSETPDSLAAYIDKLSRKPRCAIQLVDPQFYATTVPNGNMGKLIEYPYFRPDLSVRNFRAPRDITQMVGATLEFQRRLAVTHLCSPTIAIDAFNDRWSSIALNLASESIGFAAVMGDGRPLLVSLLIHEQALRSQEQLEEFLDELTDLECHGFYIVIRHEGGGFSQLLDPASVNGLLYAIHVLSEVNEFEVYVGYSDFISPLLHAAGATATASGWNNGLRRFSFARFEPQAGGRRAKPRYSSRPLLNFIPITPEFDAIAALRLTNAVISGTSYDRGFRSGTPSMLGWDDTTSALHHWQVLVRLISDTIAAGDTVGRLAHIEARISEAIELYRRLDRARIPFEVAAGPGHLSAWGAGLREFRAQVEREG